MGESSRTRRTPPMLLPLVVVVTIAGLVVLGLLTWPREDELAAASPRPSVIVGIPGGAVIPDPTSPPTPSAVPAPSEAPAEPTPVPTLAPAAEPPPELTAEAAPAPTTPPVQTPEPTAVIVAVAGPADTVAAFYAAVVDGAFDDAYALWSARMRATYPREVNLDSRFDETASITFQQLAVVEQGPGSATVQANFTETSDAGSSQDFIGFWRLVQVDGRWLLDEPHY